MYEVTLKITLIISLLVNSARQGYLPCAESRDALRPMAFGNHEIDTNLNNREKLEKFASGFGLFFHEYYGMHATLENSASRWVINFERLIKSMKGFQAMLEIDQSVVEQASRALEDVKPLVQKLKTAKMPRSLKDSIPDRKNFDKVNYASLVKKVMKGVERLLKKLDKLDFSDIEIPSYKYLKFEKKSFAQIVRYTNILKSRCRRFIKTRGEFDFYGEPSGTDTKEALYDCRLYFGKGTNITKVFKIADDLPKVKIDPDLLGEVFFNIIRNAMEAGGKKINITASHNKKQVIVEIRDNGKGIQAQDLEHIFDPYWTNGKDYGTGLGLYICNEVIKAAGGELKVKSTLGKGATFTISLPAISDIGQRDTKASPADLIELANKWFSEKAIARFSMEITTPEGQATKINTLDVELRLAGEGQPSSAMPTISKRPLMVSYSSLLILPLLIAKDKAETPESLAEEVDMLIRDWQGKGYYQGWWRERGWSDEDKQALLTYLKNKMIPADNIAEQNKVVGAGNASERLCRELLSYWSKQDEAAVMRKIDELDNKLKSFNKWQDKWHEEESQGMEDRETLLEKLRTLLELLDEKLLGSTGEENFYYDVHRVEYPGFTIYQFEPPYGGNFHLIQYASHGSVEYILVETGCGIYYQDILRMLKETRIDLGKNMKYLKEIWLTHADADHAGSSGFFAEKFGIPIRAHRNCWEVMRNRVPSNPLSRNYTELVRRLMWVEEPPKKKVLYFKEPSNEMMRIGEIDFKVLETINLGPLEFAVLENIGLGPDNTKSPGTHTKDTVYFYSKAHKILFTGDSLSHLNLNSEEDGATHKGVRIFSGHGRTYILPVAKTAHPAGAFASIDTGSFNLESRYSGRLSRSITPISTYEERHIERLNFLWILRFLHDQNTSANRSLMAREMNAFRQISGVGVAGHAMTTDFAVSNIIDTSA